MSTLFEKFFFFYFLILIPIAIFFDSQIVFPKEYFHETLLNASEIVSLCFKDQLFQLPPEWFQVLVYLEIFIHLPFAFVAVYAFGKGGQAWIRTPAIVYSSHAATTLVPIIYHILTHKFQPSERFPGPETLEERLKLSSVYSIFFFIPLVLLIQMLLNPDYGQPDKQKKLKSK